MQHTKDLQLETRNHDQMTTGLELEVQKLEQEANSIRLQDIELGLNVKDLAQDAMARRQTRREMEVAMDTFGRDHYVLFGILFLLVTFVWIVNNILEKCLK